MRKYALSVLEDSQTVGQLLSDGNGMGVKEQYQEAEVFSLDYEGRGVAKVDGKTVFIGGALPGEHVTFVIHKEKKQFAEAQVEKVLKASSERVEPECCYFDTCGGCSLQHVSFGAQVALKQRILEEQLERIGKVKPEIILPPLYGYSWYYRDRARLSVSMDKQGRLKLGFQAKKSHDVVNIRHCHILPKYVSDRLPDVRNLLQKLHDDGVKVKFVEFYCGKNVTVLNIRFVNQPFGQILSELRNWFDKILSGAEKAWQIWLQDHAESLPFYPENVPALNYTFAQFDVEMPYKPGDFTQINAQLNEVMVARAVRLLNPQKGERIADLFCGLGNFSLPLAKSGALVVGIEGADYLVDRARENARLNRCAENMTFSVADLFDTDEKTVESWGKFDKMLLDPPRSGAYAVVKSLHKPFLPQKIVYVSCNPSTFARDAGVLVDKGYKFKAAGIMNMFAQTSHVESIGVFEL